MVPTLAPVGDDPPSIARASYPGSYHHSNPGMSSYYPPSASPLTAAAAVGHGGGDPRDYGMPASHHGGAVGGYGSQWAYGRSHQSGVPHHLGGPGMSSVRHLPPQYPPSNRPPWSSPDGMSHPPPDR
jgi:hypothetical protein